MGFPRLRFAPAQARVGEEFEDNTEGIPGPTGWRVYLDNALHLLNWSDKP